jgi:prephenate dehydrogenase
MALPGKIISSIGILGFGMFGKLLAEHLHRHFPLYVFDPDVFDPALPPIETGVRRAIVFSDIATVAGCEIVVLAVPVDQISPAIAALRPHLRPGTIVLDVGSVKVQPVEAMQAGLPAFVDIVGTHPLFGPQSASGGIKGLKIAICQIRGRGAYRVAAFLRHVLGLRVFLTTPDAHDREAAIVQGLTHLIAKVLVRMEPFPTRLTTRSFELLVAATEMVRYDAPSVFLAIERANPHAAVVRERFFTFAEETRRLLESDPGPPARPPVTAPE